MRDDLRNKAASAAALRARPRHPLPGTFPEHQLDSLSLTSKLTVSQAIATCLTEFGVQGVAKALVGIASSFSRGLWAGRGACADKTLGPMARYWAFR